MKYLVLGAGGMAGHVISKYLLEQGHDVLGFDKNKVSHCPSVSGDAQNKDLIIDIIKSSKYNAVINCIGVLNQSAENNKMLAVYLNSYFPHFLADVTKEMDTQIIHMSTDCVFSGKKGSYIETDFKDGETFYDRTKALGELSDNKNLTLRNSIVGPDINPSGIGLLNWFMKQDGPIKGFSKTMWTGLTTLQLAKTMEEASKVKATGLYNMVYKESISKYDLLCLFNKYLKNNKLQIEKVDGILSDKSLKRTNFEFEYLIPDYEKMVSEMAEWIFLHKDFYNNYKLGV